MTHDTFGKLKYKDADECWVGQAPLARFAAHGARAEPPPPTEEEAARMIADMNQALDGMRGMMREQFGPAADDVFAAIDAETDQATEAEAGAPDPHAEARARKRQERAQKRAARLARGRYPVRVADPDGGGPRPPQAAAFRHLVENEPAVLGAVLGQVWDSFERAYEQEHWRKIVGLQPAAAVDDLRGRFALVRVEVARPHRGGFAHLVFTVDADWQDDHGLLVVYSPDAGTAAWTTFDGIDDLTPSDDPAAGEEYAPTPHDELVEAVLNGDEARARELAAAGVDINALAAGEYPPLCMAVDQMEVDEVRRLLAFGADPTLADPDEGATPLRMARRVYKEMGFGPAKKKDPLLDAMMLMAREAAGKQFDEMKARLDEIIRLLEEAGGK
jgi:hypothetical protein